MKLLFIVLMFSFGLCNAMAWDLSGTVSSKRGPVSGVFVEVRSGITDRPIWTRTDRTGQFHLTGPQPGRYTLTVQKKDNLPDVMPRSLTLQGGTKIIVDIHIPESGVLAGRVVGSGERPVESALVRAFSVRRDHTGAVHLVERGGDRTNDRGEFRVPYLEEGRYVLVATSRVLGFEKQSALLPVLRSTTLQSSFYPAGHDFESAAVLDLKAGQELSDLIISASSKPAVCLAFRVGEGFSGGGHLSGAVEDESATNGPQLAMGNLSTNQSYQVCGLAQGEYRLRIQNLTVQDRRFHILGAQAETVDLSKGSVNLGVVEPLGSGRVSGVVRLSEQAPTSGALSGMELMLTPLRLELPVIETLHVQADGTFSDADVVRGEYRLSALSVPAGYYVVEASQKGRNVLAGGLLPDDGDVQIRLENNGAAVSGLVGDAGTPVMDATVFLVSDDGAVPLHVQSDQDGKYSFNSGVPPGSYRLIAVSAVSEGERDDTDFARTISKQGSELQLQAGQRQTLDLQVSK